MIRRRRRARRKAMVEINVGPQFNVTVAKAHVAFVVVAVGEQIAVATGMIKSAAGAASYLVEHANRRTNLAPWYEGIIDGAGLKKNDPRLLFRRVMFAMARKQAGQVMRRRDTREHVALYIKAFNAWATGEELTQLRFTSRETMPPVTKMR